MGRGRHNPWLVLVAGWLALLAQATVAFQAGWHHHAHPHSHQVAAGHDHAHHGHSHSHNHGPVPADGAPAEDEHPECPTCTAIAGQAWLPELPDTVEPLRLVERAPESGGERPANPAGRCGLGARGPPAAS